MNNLLEKLLAEKNAKMKGGLYHKTQINLAYNSNRIVPFIIEEQVKMFYYRGLSEFVRVREYLIDTCKSAQDEYKTWVIKFYPEINLTENENKKRSL